MKPKPKKWVNVYPHGTQEGDEELKFFISLARNSKYQWRSTSAIARETGLSRERVEEIITKYYKQGMIFQNPKNEDQWGYWERNQDMLPDIQDSISKKDKNDRIKRANKSCTEVDADDNMSDIDISDSTSLDFITGGSWIVCKKNVVDIHGWAAPPQIDVVTTVG